MRFIHTATGGQAMRDVYFPQSAICDIKDVNFIRVSRDKGFSVDFPEGKENHGFRFVKSGSILYRLPSHEGVVTQLTARAGEVVFIPCGVPFFARYTEDNTVILLAQFDTPYDSLPQVLKQAGKLKMNHIPYHLDEIFERRSFGGSEESRAYHSIFRMYELIWDAVDSEGKSSPKFMKLSPAIKEMGKNFREQRKISYYADLCGMSETGFRRLFAEYTGMSPIEYRNRIRLSEARNLIGTGEYLIEEAADAVGFSNISFFCRSYKKLFGRTPLGK